MYNSESKIKNILLAVVCIAAFAMAIFNKSYVVSGMFIVTAFALAYVQREDSFYDLFYGLLLISTIYDYVLYVPNIKNVYLFHLVLAGFTLYTLFKIYKDRSILDKIDKKLIGILFVWFAYMCISVLWSGNKILSIKFLAIYIMMFCFIFDLMVYNINKERLKRSIYIIVSLLSLMIVIGFFESVIGKQLPVVHHYDGMKLLNTYSHNALKSRPIAFSFNPNNLAATLGILMPMCFFASTKVKETWTKVFLLVISSLSFAVTVLTTSRTGFAASVFGFAVYVIYCVFNVKGKGIKILICPLILTATFVFSYYNAYKVLNVAPVENEEKIIQNDMSNKMEVLKDYSEIEIGGEGSVNVRATIIHDVLEDFLVNKNIKGNGVGNVQQFIRDKDNTAGIYSPHCYPIEILCEFGLPGVIIYGIYYLYLLMSNIILGIKKKNIWCFAAVAGLVAFAPASFGPSSITYVFSYWILMAFSVSCLQAVRNSN